MLQSGADPGAGAALEEATAASPISPAMATIARTGPGLLTEAFFAALDDGDSGCAALPPSFFHPSPNADSDKDGAGDERRRARARQESFTVHHWASSWQTE